MWVLVRGLSLIIEVLQGWGGGSAIKCPSWKHEELSSDSESQADPGSSLASKPVQMSFRPQTIKVDQIEERHMQCTSGIHAYTCVFIPALTYIHIHIPLTYTNGNALFLCFCPGPQVPTASLPSSEQMDEDQGLRKLVPPWFPRNELLSKTSWT